MYLISNERNHPMLEIRYTKKTLRGSLAKQLVRLSKRLVIKNPVYSDASFGKLYSLKLSPDFDYPKGIASKWIDLPNSKMEWIYSTEKTCGNVILQFHGGAYYKPYNDTYRRSAIKYHQISHGSHVFSLDYRVAPIHPFPAALDDALDAYRYLLENKFDPNKIIVVGDSAGGGLTLALCMKLRDLKLPMPKALITMSAWTDLASEGESYLRNQLLDPMLGNHTLPLEHNDYVSNNDVYNPYISPAYGTFESFPPMMMHVGSHEVLESDTLTVAKKASDAGVDVQVTLYRGMFHVFQLAFGLIPDAKKAWKEIENYIETKFIAC
jgi:acetyl esterase/lipase